MDKKLVRHEILLSMVVLVAILATVSVVSATDIYVNETGWWDDPLQFNESATPIQSAVDYASDGDTIIVKPGSYSECILVDVGDLIIRGESLDAIVDGGFELKADNITIDGLTIKNGCYFDTGIAKAIFTRKADNPTDDSKDHKIINNVIIGPGDNTGHGINVVTSSGEPVDILIDNNTIREWRIAIMQEGDNVTITNNSLCDNLESGIDLERVDYTTIKFNDIIDNGVNGIWIAADKDGVDSFGTVINYNNIHNNKEYGLMSNTLQEVDARYNYWCSPCGPRVEGYCCGRGDKISGNNVTYKPWLDAPYPDGNPIENVCEYDEELPVIVEARAVPDTISMIGGPLDWIAWDNQNCECVIDQVGTEVIQSDCCWGCRQTHSYGPMLTTLIVNATDNCDNDLNVTLDYSAIIYQMFGPAINEFNEEEKARFDEKLTELIDETDIEWFWGDCGENSYRRPMISIGPVIAFFYICDYAGIEVDMATILLEQMELGDIKIPIKVEDGCGNNVTRTLTVTIVDYQVPLKEGWNVRSVPIALDVTQWSEIAELGDGLSHDGAYRYDTAAEVFKKLPEDYDIKPLEAFYIRMKENDQMAILLDKDITSPPTRLLNPGYNLIGTAILPFETMRADLCLKSINVTPAGLPGYTNVISLMQYVNYMEWYCDEDDEDCGACVWIPVHPKWFVQKPWVYTAGQGIEDNPKLGQQHYLCKYWMDNGGGYWVYMENTDELAGFTTTPVYLINIQMIKDSLRGESLETILEGLYTQYEQAAQAGE